VPDGPEPLSSAHMFIFILCLLLSMFISSSEFSLTTLSKIRLREMVAENVKNASLVEKLLNNTHKLTLSLRVGSNLAKFGAMAIALKAAVNLIENDNTAMALAAVILSFFLLIFCEIIPKSLSSQNSDKMSLKVAKPVNFMVILLTPIVAFINVISGFFIKLLGGNKNKPLPAITEAEIMTMINMGQQEGILEINEQQMISNVFSFGDYKAKDVMVPRPDITAIEIGTPYEEIVELFKEEGYSRLPVYEDTPDTIIGILYLKDIAFLQKEEFGLKKCMREPFYTYELKPTLELFATMKEKGISMAIVLDEYGGTAGLVTIEDFIEEIVGDISDEYDDIENEIEVVKEDEYIVDGSTRLDTVNEMLGIRLESEDFDSVGGYVMGILGRIPEEGDEVEQDNIRFKVESLDKNRIEKIRIFT